jgi:CheY-like chemotaxis protein
VAGQQPVDVLISDIDLPDGDGCELLRRLRAFYGGRAVTAIALSGLADEPLSEACKRAGFGHFLVKPVTFDQVLAAVQSACPIAAARSADPRDHAPALGGVPAPLVD